MLHQFASCILLAGENKEESALTKNATQLAPLASGIALEPWT